MQVSATLIAAQQAAREAQARFHAQHVAPNQAFAATLDKNEGFAPLPLKGAATPAPAAPAMPMAGPKSAAGPVGRQLNILV